MGVAELNVIFKWSALSSDVAMPDFRHMKFWGWQDVQMMSRALALAYEGRQAAEVPVGAVLVHDGRVMGEGYNCPIGCHDATAHAEIIAIRQACQDLQNYRLPAGTTLYVTLEPCTMCWGALIHARVDRVVFATAEPKAGVLGSQIHLDQMSFYNHTPKIHDGLMAHQSATLLSRFFKERRQAKKQAKQASQSLLTSPNEQPSIGKHNIINKQSFTPKGQNMVTHITNPIITIDGPSGAGKGTLAYRLANALGLPLLDSGALYRIVGLVAHQRGLLTEDIDENAVAQMTCNLKLAFVVDAVEQCVRIIVDGEPLVDDIRNETVGAYASKVAVLPAVRSALLDVQRNMANTGVVADGRDMGTVIFPQAHAKIFLTAGADERAKRRVAQLEQAGKTADYDSILADIVARDERDAKRQASPCKPADDALVLDSSKMTADEVYQSAVAFCQSKGVLFA